MSDLEWWERDDQSDNIYESSPLAELLFEQVERGSADPEARAAALMRAVDIVNSSCRDAHGLLSHDRKTLKWEERHRIALALSDAVLVGVTIQDLLQADKGRKVGLSITQPPGRPVDWARRKARLERENRAARLVEFLVKRGGQKSWAVLLVAEKRGLTRKRVYEALARRDFARAVDPDAPEALILSLILMRD